MESMRIVRQKGVSYTIVTNSLAATDESLVHIGYRRYRPEMLRLGVALYELSPKRVEETKRFGIYGSASGRLHGKSAVIDRNIVFIGSMNFDPRSMLHNTEVGIFIFSPQIAQQLTSLIGFMRLDGAYQLQLGPRGGIEWVSPASGDGARHHPARGARNRFLVALEAGAVCPAGAREPALAARLRRHRVPSAAGARSGTARGRRRCRSCGFRNAPSRGRCRSCPFRQSSGPGARPRFP